MSRKFQTRSHLCYRSSFDIAWTHILANEHIWDSDTLFSWKKLFGDPPEIEDFRFPRLHKAYLGLSEEHFNQRLCESYISEVDQTDKHGRTLLSWAAQRGDYESIALLLNLGSSPNKADNDRRTPLHMSCHVMDIRCIELLVSAGADVSARTRDGRTMAFLVAEKADRPDVLRLFLEHGEDINSHTSDGWTLLHSAARGNRLNNIRSLVRAGIQVDATTRSGDDAIAVAVTSNTYEALCLLLHVTPTKKIQDAFEIYVDRAVTWGDLETIAILTVVGLKDLRSTKSHDRERLVSLVQRLILTRSHDEWSEPFLHLPHVDAYDWFHAFKELARNFIDIERIVSQTSLEATTFAERKDALTADQLIWNDPGTLPDPDFPAKEHDSDVSLVRGHPGHMKSMTESTGSIEAKIEATASEDMAGGQRSVAASYTPKSGFIDTGSFLLFLLILSFIVSFIFLLVSAVLTVKSLSSLVVALPHYPRFLFATGLLLLFGTVVHMNPWWTRTLSPDSINSGFGGQALTPRFNRLLLWISTPGITIHFKPWTLDIGNWRWAHNTKRAITEFFTGLRSTLLRASRKLGIAEPVLAEGKRRVRWRCVSLAPLTLSQATA